VPKPKDKRDDDGEVWGRIIGSLLPFVLAALTLVGCVGRLGEFKLSAVDEWVRAGGAQR